MVVNMHMYNIYMKALTYRMKVLNKKRNPDRPTLFLGM